MTFKWRNVLYDTMFCYMAWPEVKWCHSVIMLCHIVHSAIWHQFIMRYHAVLCNVIFHDIHCVMWHHLILYDIILYYAQLTQHITFKTAVHQKQMVTSTDWSPGKILQQFCSCSHQLGYFNSKETALHLKQMLIELFF